MSYRNQLFLFLAAWAILWTAGTLSPRVWNWQPIAAAERIAAGR